MYSHSCMKKRCFILLEILIALTIVSLLASYLIYRPFRELKQELSTLIALEEDRVWEGKLIELEYMLRRNCASLAEKPVKDETSFFVFLPNMTKKCTKRYEASAKHKPDEKTKNEHYLIHLSVKRLEKKSPKLNYTFHEIRCPASSPNLELKPD